MGFEQIWQIWDQGSAAAGTVAGPAGPTIMQSLFLMATWIIYGVLIFGGLGILCWWVYRQIKYNIDVMIYECVGEDQVIKKIDRAAIIKYKDGKSKFQLMKLRKVKLPPPHSREYTLKLKTTLFGKTKVVKSIDLIHYGSTDYDYFPMTMKVGKVIETTEFRKFPFNTISWGLQEVKNDAIKYSKQSEIMQKYLLPISLVFIIIMCVVVAYFISGNLRQLITMTGDLVQQGCMAAGSGYVS